MKIRCSADRNQQKDVVISHQSSFTNVHSFGAYCKDKCPINSNNKGVLPIVKMTYDGVCTQFEIFEYPCDHAQVIGRTNGSLRDEIERWKSGVLEAAK